LGLVVYRSKQEAQKFFRWELPQRLEDEWDLPQRLEDEWVDIHKLSSSDVSSIKQTGCLHPIHPGHEDFEAVWYLWQHHRDASHPRWVGRDITHFSVGNIPGAMRYRVHVVNRRSGANLYQRFSYGSCLNNKQHAETFKKGGWAGPVAPTSSAELARANKEAAAIAAALREQKVQEGLQPMPNSYYLGKMRSEVAGFVRRFWEEFRAGSSLEFKCPINGSMIIGLQDCHVDHDPPFAVLAEQWLQQEDMQLADVGKWTQAQRQSWRHYHNTHANLRMVSREGNLCKNKEDKEAVAAVRRSRRNARPSKS
jgi:hypothetical protein